MRDMTRFLIAVAMTAGSAAPAVSAHLCRDSKGLFTPCVGERTPPSRPHAHRDDGHAETRSAAADAPRAGPMPDRPKKPPVVSRTRLCRDSKGLFTPCPR